MNPSFIDICRQQPGVKTADSSLSDSTSSSNDREHTVVQLVGNVAGILQQSQNQALCTLHQPSKS